MKLVIPMAGRGTRLRPHSLTTPKPLLPVAGPMLVERIVASFAASVDRNITDIAFVLGDFGPETEQRLAGMARRFGAEPHFFQQHEALGTAHAVHCAAPVLSGEIIVAFADTLFRVSEQIDLDDADSMIWLKKVDDPSRFGVAVIENGRITRFVEKPTEPVSNMAIIGVYYFREGERLLKELQYLMDNDIRGHKNEFDLTDAIDRLLRKNSVFKAADVEEWLDFGTIPAWLASTAAVLDLEKDQHAMDPRTDVLSCKESRIIPPCFIGRNVTITKSTIGPCASIGNDCTISGSHISNSIIMDNTTITECRLTNTTVGAHVTVAGFKGELHVGDFSAIQK